MTGESTKQSYLGVRCLSCRQPIPVPSILVRTAPDVPGDESVLLYEQHNRVFSLRCRSCEKEKPYRASDIIEFDGEPVTRRSRVRTRFGHTGRLARAASG